MKRLLLIFALFFAFALPKIWAADSDFLGNVDEVTVYPGSIHLRGWIFYKPSPGNQVSLRVDASSGDNHTASQWWDTTEGRADVVNYYASSYSGVRLSCGFDVYVDTRTWTSGQTYTLYIGGYDNGTKTQGYSLITRTVTVQAPYTIHFDMSLGGSNYPSDFTKAYGLDATIPASPVPTFPAGYAFTGYSRIKDNDGDAPIHYQPGQTFTDADMSDFPAIVGNSVTLYPTWAPSEHALYCADNKTLYFTYGTLYSAGDTYTADDGTTHTITAVYTDFNRGYSYVDGSHNYLAEDGTETVGTSAITTAPWAYYTEQATTTIDFQNSFQNFTPTSLAYWFDKSNNLTKVKGGSNLNTSSVTSLESSFCQCINLTELDVSGWNTANVKSMSLTFAECMNLTELDVSNWNTANVTTMYETFRFCAKLTELDVSGWNTANVKSMYYTFYQCERLTELDVSNWNTANVTNMAGTFRDCVRLTELNVSGWNTASVTNMSNIFFGCEKLTELDVSGWNTANVMSMQRSFSRCESLTSLTFGRDFSTEGIYSILGGVEDMFFSDSKLRFIDFYASTDVDAITLSDYSSMFNGIPATTVVYLPAGSSEVTSQQNVVYTDGTELKCPKYYSMDKVDIEFPRTFKTNTAEYTRTMSNTYGSVVLPYAFTSNDDIQAYTLQSEKSGAMYFVDEETVPAHTPFAFKKLGSADFTMTDESGNFGIIVNATRDTQDSPYTSDYTVDITGKSTTYTWGTKGYYVQQEVSDYSDAFYIASDKFYRADGTLTMYPHRVTFHGAWQLGNGSSSNSARFYEITTGEHEIATAIEAAEVRKTEREAAAIYDAQGRRHQQLQHGMNIIRMQDGTIRKVVK